MKRTIERVRASDEHVIPEIGKPLCCSGPHVINSHDTHFVYNAMTELQGELLCCDAGQLVLGISEALKTQQLFFSPYHFSIRVMDKFVPY